MKKKITHQATDSEEIDMMQANCIVEPENIDGIQEDQDPEIRYNAIFTLFYFDEQRDDSEWTWQQNMN
jgi:hypothetical protein